MDQQKEKLDIDYQLFELLEQYKQNGSQRISNNNVLNKHNSPKP